MVIIVFTGDNLVTLSMKGALAMTDVKTITIYDVSQKIKEPIFEYLSDCEVTRYQSDTVPITGDVICLFGDTKKAGYWLVKLVDHEVNHIPIGRPVAQSMASVCCIPIDRDERIRKIVKLVRKRKGLCHD